MEQSREDAPLAVDSRTGSEEVLVQPSGPTSPRVSNGRAVKIAGLTTLACLLLAAQVFTAYMVFDQRQQIQGLQVTHQKMQTQMDQPQHKSPKKIMFPSRSFHILDMFGDSGKVLNPTTKTAKPQVEQDKTSPGVEEELQDFMKDFELPHFNQSFLANLQTLKQQVNETSWKSFESWLRYWLLFQMAQKTPTPNPTSPAMTKCQIEAKTGVQHGLVGSFRPQCDEQGNYRSMQCWHATRQCWCVDENGNRIEGSSTSGQPDCDEVLRSRGTLFDDAKTAELLAYDKE